MKAILKTVIPLIVFVMLPGAVSAQVTLEDCIRCARENYPQIKELGIIEEAEKFDLSNISKKWIPQLTVSGKASYQSDVTEMPFEMPGFSFDMPHDQYSIIGEISQTIWDGGTGKKQKDLVISGAEVQKSQIEVALYSLNDKVRKIFLGILLYDAQLSQNAILEESLERNAEQTRNMIENGIAYKPDLDIIQVNILTCQMQKDELETMKSAYTSMLEKLTGMSLKGKILTMPKENVDMAVPLRINRPELALYEAQLRQNDSQMKKLNADISPKFSLSIQGGYGRPGLNMLKNEFQPYWTAGLRMQWNIGALYTRKNEKRKIDTQARQIEIQRETFLLNTDIDISEKRSAIEKARKALEKDDEIIMLRQSIRSAGEEQYRNGTITMTELMQRIDDEHTAMAAKSIHEIQLAMAIYDLKNTAGL